MKILMMTNTYSPHVGGVAHSVKQFTEEYRRMGHEVVVVAPEFETTPENEKNVIRVPAIQNFNGSDFSVVLPIPGFLVSHLDTFRPDLIHSHHPFLLGTSALRLAARFNIPLVFTYHTMYEKYTHYVPGDSKNMQRFIIHLSSGYANMCSQVIAPSDSVAEILRERGVETPIEVIPTGVDIEQFSSGDREGFRNRHDLTEAGWVVGHLGRLAEEKNIGFLAEAVAEFLKRRADAYFLVVGKGPSEALIKKLFEEAGMRERLRMTGSLEGQDLVDAYHAMDVFVFASKSETQGMVLVEAMSAGLPVVVLDAFGVRCVVKDRANGRLVKEETQAAFVKAIEWVADLPIERRDKLARAARKRAAELSMSNCARKALDLYERVIEDDSESSSPSEDNAWYSLLDQIRTEWDIFVNLNDAAMSALSSSDSGSGEE